MGSFLTAFSQEPVYRSTRTFGGNSSDVPYRSVLDAAGAIYTVGNFSTTADFDPGPGVHYATVNGNTDVFLSKHDVQGRLVWVKTFGGTGYDYGQSISLNKLGQVIIGGYFQNTVDFDPGQDTLSISATPDTDFYISGFDATGNLIWVRTVGGAHGRSLLLNSKVDEDNNVYSIGYFRDTVDFDPGPDTFLLISKGNTDIYILKLDLSGNFVWAKQFGGVESEMGRCIDIDENGNVYAAGFFSTVCDFDPGPSVYNLTSAGNKDVFIIKLDEAGNLIWAKQIGGTEWEDNNGLALDAEHSVYLTGVCEGTIDFDPGPGVHQLQSHGYVDAYIVKLKDDGELQWAGTIGSSGNDFGKDISIDLQGNVYICGSFQGNADMDPGVNNYTLNSNGGRDAFMMRLDTDGHLVWALGIGGYEGDQANTILTDQHNNVLCSGLFNSTVDFNAGVSTDYIDSKGDADVFITRYAQYGVVGSIFNDIIENCEQANNEIGLGGRLGIIQPGGFVVQTDANGRWFVDSLPISVYNITFDTSGEWKATCPVTSLFEVTDLDQITLAPDFGLKSIEPCPIPSVSVSVPFLRRCFTNQYVYINACNLPTATTALNEAYVIVYLDSIFIPTSASIPFIYLGSNQYRFEVGTLFPGECFNIRIATTISCDASLGQTICVQATLLPYNYCDYGPGDTFIEPGSPPCAYETDNSNITVDGWCTNDSIYYVVSNTGAPGSGNMKCYAPVRLFIDTKLFWVDSIQLAGGKSDTLIFSGDGRTWRLEADQHPMRTGRSHPSATVERCGSSVNWTPGLYNNLPLDDEDSHIDINCGEVRASYDPNDKKGYPLGVEEEHLIRPNGQLEYTIRFQNTGTDTAFFVMIRDTLDEDVDIFSVHPGAASHPYQFRMYGTRILEWMFENILLPDSTTDLAGSNGFVSFTIDQNRNLSDGIKIENKAAIYFDYNDPVITNTTVHTINRIDQPSWSEQKEIFQEACGPFTYGGITYDKTGSYLQIAEGEFGHDTLVVIHFIILTSPYFLIVEQDGNILTSQATADSYQWFDCLSGNLLAGETNPVFTPSYNGEFAVIVSENGCIDTSDCFNVTMVGTDENYFNNQIAIYPNPTSGHLIVGFMGKTESAELILYDLLGRKVHHKNITETAMTTMDIALPGLYFLLVKTRTTHQIFKVIRK